MRNSRLAPAIDATAEEMEKNTSGTTVTNRALRNTSPSGLSTPAAWPKCHPTAEPIRIDPMRISDIL